MKQSKIQQIFNSSCTNPSNDPNSNILHSSNYFIVPPTKSWRSNRERKRGRSPVPLWHHEACYLSVKSSGPSPKNKTSTSFWRAIRYRQERRLWILADLPLPTSPSDPRFESNSYRVGNSTEYPALGEQWHGIRVYEEHLFAIRV